MENTEIKAMEHQFRSEVGVGNRGNTELRVDDQICHLLRKAHRRSVAIMANCVGDEDLTPLQYLTLCKLNEIGKESQNRLGRHVAMDPATNQGVIQRLLQKNLIQRAADPHDRRRSLLSITDDGRALLETLSNQTNKAESLMLCSLTDQEKAQLKYLLIKIG